MNAFLLSEHFDLDDRIVVHCHLFGGVGEEVRRNDQVGLDVVLLTRQYQKRKG